MTGPLDRHLPDSPVKLTFVFGVLMFFVLPVVIILAVEAPEFLGLGIVAVFGAWFLGRVGALPSSDDESAAEPAATDPMATLQERYARGEIDEVELERRLDRLVELESLDDEASERVASGREREFERET